MQETCKCPKCGTTHTKTEIEAQKRSNPQKEFFYIRCKNCAAQLRMFESYHVLGVATVEV